MKPRFCQTCGGRLRAVRDGDRLRLRCPRCGWTFYGNPVLAVVALIASRGRVLLTRRAQPPYAGTWDVPGGFLEAGETPDAGLRRELQERSWESGSAGPGCSGSPPTATVPGASRC